MSKMVDAGIGRLKVGVIIEVMTRRSAVALEKVYILRCEIEDVTLIVSKGPKCGWLVSDVM